MLSMESPLTVQRVGQKVRIPTELSLSSLASDCILSNKTFQFGENLTNFVISKAMSSASQYTLQFLRASEIAKLRARQ